MTLNDKIVSEIEQRVYVGDNEVCGIENAALAIEKLIIQEQLDLLKNFYYGEDLKDHEILDFYKRVLETAKEELTQRLNKLKSL